MSAQPSEEDGLYAPSSVEATSWQGFPIRRWGHRDGVMSCSCRTIRHGHSPPLPYLYTPTSCVQAQLGHMDRPFSRDVLRRLP